MKKKGNFLTCPISPHSKQLSTKISGRSREKRKTREEEGRIAQLFELGLGFSFSIAFFSFFAIGLLYQKENPLTTLKNHSFMILSLPPHNLTKVLILIQNWSSFFTKASLIVLLILVQSFALIPTETIQSNSQTMKVHPIPKKRNITIQYDMNSRNPLSEAQALLGLTHKKLRRLPHVFSRVLELPFRSDADVLVEETPDCFRFVAETDGIGDVRAHTVEIHPGVTKIVVRESGSVELSLDELELDMWRFRLPESTRPELASAVFVDGELIVTVPKGEELENSEDGSEASDEEMWGDGNGDFGGGMGGRLVLVQ